MLKIPTDVKRQLKATSMPVPKRMVRRAYVFGSSVQGLEYHDIDIALIVDPMSPIFQDKLVILQIKIEDVEYHIIPDYLWFKKRLDESSVNVRLKKKYLSDSLSKNSLLHQLGFRGFIYTFSHGNLLKGLK